MLILTSKGLYCSAGDFYIDPNGAVDTAVITHGHSDHARRGSKKYYCTTSGKDILNVRLGKKISVTHFPYREKFRIKDVEISFHPAGHILGSSQVRLEFCGEVWVVSGDYKREADSTCEAFENVVCDVFITEATFGTPAFSWNKSSNHGVDISNWNKQNSAQGFNSVLFAYSLGKAQRILGALAPFINKPIYCHPAVEELNICYRNQGVELAPTLSLDDIPEGQTLENEFVLAPPAFLKSPRAALLGSRFKTAFASGWMRSGGGRHYNRDGFVMSDHADWNDLLLTIQQSAAKRVYVQHRGHGALVRELKSRGIKAFADTALIPKNPAQLFLF